MSRVSFRILLVFALWIAGIGSGTAQSLKPIVFAVSSPKEVSASPIFIAKHLGYFSEEGVDPKIVVMPSDIGMKGLVSGDVDFASSLSSVSKAAAVGAPLKIVVSFFNGSFFYLVTRPGITHIEQLRGKTVAVSRYGSATDFDARAAFRHFGLDPSKDVSILAVGGGANRLVSLLSGRAEAAIVNNIEKLQAEKSGMKALLFTGQYAKQPVGGLGTSSQRILDRRDDVRRAVRAVYRALALMKTDRNKVKAFFVKELGVKPEQSDDIYGDTMKVFLANGKIDLEDLAGTYEDARKQAINPPQVPLTALVDYSILEEVRKTVK